MRKAGFTPLEKAVDFNQRSYPIESGGRFLPPSARTVRGRSSLTGFTLIELMLVVIIISVLAAMVVPSLTGRSEEARVGVAKADVEVNIATALKLYEMDNGAFPATAEGLDSLIAAPSSAKHWKGPYLEKKPLDPWGKPYQYKSPGIHRTKDYDLFSLGRDGIESSDDVVNWI